MKTAVILSAYKNPKTLERVISNYLDQKAYPEELIVAEDGDQIDLKSIISSFDRIPFRIIHVQQKDNGFRKASILNKAVVSSHADYLIFSDSDCIPHFRFISDHLAYRKKGTAVTATRAYVDQTIVDQFDRNLWSQIGHLRKNLIYPKKVAVRVPMINWRSNTTPIGANMAVWREDFIKVNGFDESFEGWGHEDLEFLDRLTNSGIRNNFRHQQCILYHLNHQESSKINDSLNQQKLDQTRAEKRTFCESGISKYKYATDEEWKKEILAEAHSAPRE